MSEKRQGADDTALDALLMVLWPQVKRGDQRAIDRVLRIMERRGLEGPTPGQGGVIFTDEERVKRNRGVAEGRPGMNETRGRRTKCTPALTERAADLLKLGLSDTEAIELLPIGRSAFYGGIQRGEAATQRLDQPGARRRKREAPFVAFSDSIKGAKAARIEALLARIWDAASGRGTSSETRCTYDGEGKLTARIVTEKSAPATWQAAAWLLERLHWETFSQHKMLEQTTDWRAEARAAGIEDPEALFEDLVQRYQVAFEESAYA